MTERAAGDGAVAREPVRRLFFAAWPDDAAHGGLQEVLRRHVAAGTGRPQRPDQWHLTLQFLGDVPESRLPALFDAGAVASAGAAGCDLEFEHLEYWKRPEVLCLVAGSIPVALESLVLALRRELARRGFEAESRPFKAHVTLARKVRRPPPLVPAEPLRWAVRSLSLVQSVTERSGSRYVELASWPLGD